MTELESLICTTREIKDQWLALFDKYPQSGTAADVFCSECLPEYRREMKAAGQCVRPTDWTPPKSAQ